MILCDKSIKKLCVDNDLIIPFSEEQLQPSSYDLTLDSEYIHPIKTDIIQIIPTNKELIINPNDFVLLTTKEFVNIPNDIVGIVDGKSSVGRLGLTCHVTAGYIDPGFKGKITLEIKNLGDFPVAIKPDVTICQIRFQRLDKECENPYNNEDNHYQNQNGVVSSRYLKKNGIYFID